jgi:hypothetical protein
MQSVPGAVHVRPPQHGSPSPPQVPHRPWPQLLPSAHACPWPRHTPSSQQPPAAHRLPAQHQDPGCPQGSPSGGRVATGASAGAVRSVGGGRSAGAWSARATSAGRVPGVSAVGRSAGVASAAPSDRGGSAAVSSAGALPLSAPAGGGWFCRACGGWFPHPAITSRHKAGAKRSSGSRGTGGFAFHHERGRRGSKTVPPSRRAPTATGPAPRGRGPGRCGPARSGAPGSRPGRRPRRPRRAPRLAGGPWP